MKVKITLFLSLVLIASALNGQTIPNGDFENVVFDDSPPAYIPNWLPNPWFSQCQGAEITADISEDSHSGNYAIRMITLPCNNFGLQRGGYITGNPGEWLPLSSSVELNERPEELHFFYKFLKQGNDSAYVEAFLFDYDTTPGIPWSERYDTIAFSSARIYEEVDEYTFFSLPINYVSDSVPDYISILFATEDRPCNLTTCTLGTTLWIDDVDVSGGTLSVREEENKIPVKLYPNPATDFFKLGTYGVIEKVLIQDYLGRRLKTYNGDREEYFIADLPPGTYLVRITTEERSVLKRLVKTE